ncbi:hypothetical protein [Haladaptatus sp. NG-SE-30]
MGHFTSRAGKITTAILIAFTIAMNPPVIQIVDVPGTIAGIGALYLWTVIWGIFITAVLIWAAWRDAFALTEDQVPPELHSREEVVTTQSSSQDTAVEGGS